MRLLWQGAARLVLLAPLIVPAASLAPLESGAQASSGGACSQDFVAITPADPACGLTLNEADTLTLEGRTLADPLVASYDMGVNGDKPIAAGKLVLFPPSPSGRFRVLQACEDARPAALCWTVLVLDYEAGRLHNTYAGKYGPQRWQSWSPEERHVVLANTNEGVWWLHVIEAASGDMTDFPDGEAEANWIIEPETLTWTGSRSFTVMVKTCEHCRAQRREIRF